MAGAILVLAAFILAQQRRLSTASITYLALNFVGTGVLAVVAGMNGDMGFFLLEGVWSIYSGWNLIGRLRALAHPL